MNGLATEVIKFRKGNKSERIFPNSGTNSIENRNKCIILLIQEAIQFIII